MIHIRAGGYVSKARPWFYGIGDPGTEKSHVIDPYANIMEEMYAENGVYQLKFM